MITMKISNADAREVFSKLVWGEANIKDVVLLPDYLSQCQQTEADLAVALELLLEVWRTSGLANNLLVRADALLTKYE